MGKGVLSTVFGLAMMIAVAPAAVAYVDAEAGASGQCYDAASNGGQDEVRVNAGVVGTTPYATYTLLTVTGAVAGLAEFGMGLAEGGAMGDACTSNDTLDYIEVDAGANGYGAQVCYDGDVRTDGGCPHSPAGPGAPG